MRQDLNFSLSNPCRTRVEHVSNLVRTVCEPMSKSCQTLCEPHVRTENLNCRGIRSNFLEWDKKLDTIHHVFLRNKLVLKSLNHGTYCTAS